MFLNKLNSAILAVFLLSSTSLYAAEKPLLEEGKSTLYQRVLTTPSCVLKKSASAKSGEKVPAFTRYYVYEDDDVSLKVGSNQEGDIDGYLDKSCTVAWKQQMALMFTNRAGRDRAIIFDSKEKLDEIINMDNPHSVVSKINKDLDNNKKLDYVVSREPEKFIDYKKQFYLLPILDSEENIFADGNTVRELKIASVNSNAKLDDNKGNDKNDITSFKAAVVFVIDSSISMQPYLDRTKEAINKIITKIENEEGFAGPLSNSVHFGLVSFRSNTKAVPGLEFESKMFVKPGEAKSIADFNKKLSNLKQANVSSKLFDEDAYSGIAKSLSDINWSQYGGRYIVLITDAGAIEGSNSLSSTGLDAKELRLEAKHHGAAIYTMHLLTKTGAKNHAKAKAQYQDLSFNEILQKPLYYGVNAGDVNAFGNMIDALSSAITMQVKLASEGKLSAGSSVSADSSDLDKDTIILGHAMQLAYLGSKQNVAVKSFLQGWIADRDLVKTNTPTSTPVVLLTKAQLSDMRDLVKNVVEAANTGILSPNDMFNELRNIALKMGKNPDEIKENAKQSIASLGLLGEYLDDLPYKSEIANIDEDYFATMSPQDQDNLIRSLESKIKYYQMYNDDTTRWIKLSDKANSSEYVYPVPLEALP